VSEVRITARENGPYLVTGDVSIVDYEGREFVRPPGTSVALCRCGHSQRKPFCDGSHKSAGFRSDDVAEREP
jgi:CDGSH-type Zn-finger protein